MLYTVPNFSNPGGTLLPAARRTALVELARQHGFVIVEDDPYGELRFAGQREPSIYETRSEEHTSELQSQSNLVCRLLLEKKKKTEHDILAGKRSRQLSAFDAVASG